MIEHKHSTLSLVQQGFFIGPSSTQSDQNARPHLCFGCMVFQKASSESYVTRVYSRWPQMPRQQGSNESLFNESVPLIISISSKHNKPPWLKREMTSRINCYCLCLSPSEISSSHCHFTRYHPILPLLDLGPISNSPILRWIRPRCVILL